MKKIDAIVLAGMLAMVVAGTAARAGEFSGSAPSLGAVSAETREFALALAARPTPAPAALSCGQETYVARAGFWSYDTDGFSEWIWPSSAYRVYLANGAARLWKKEGLQQVAGALLECEDIVRAMVEAEARLATRAPGSYLRCLLDDSQRRRYKVSLVETAPGGTTSATFWNSEGMRAKHVSQAMSDCQARLGVAEALGLK